MRYFLFLTCLGSSFLSSAQEDPANLDFEQKNSYNGLAPWYKTYFSKRKYLVALDSMVIHQGKYSLRFSYDTTSKDISEGQVVNVIPIDVIGKTLRVSGYARQSNPNDTAGGIYFLISDDKGERKIANKGNRITNSKDWKEFSSEFKLDSFHNTVHHLRITVIAHTKEIFWIDNFKIEVDGKELYSQPPFSSAKGEVIQKLSSQQISNLQVLCYVWGFLKYYHPIVATGKFNWDIELFKKIPAVKKAANDRELNLILSQWIDSLGSIPLCNNCLQNVPKNSFKNNIDLEWLNKKIISRELNQKLRFILSNRHVGDGYYVYHQPVGNLFFDHENEYNWREKEYPNELFRLQFLFRYWNTIQYFYPYKNIIGKDWNAVLEEFIPIVDQAKNSLEYHITINKLVNSVNDSHSGDYDGIMAREYGDRFLPVQTKIIQNKAVVSGFYNDSLARANGFQIGDVIVKINNETIEQIIDERISFVGGSNYSRKLYALQSRNFITGGKDSILQVEYLRDDKPYQIRTRRYNFSDFKYEKKDQPKWKILDGNIGYVNMGILGKKDVDSMMNGLRDTKAIVFDIRNYPLGTYLRICEYLKDRSSAFAKNIHPDLNYPGNFLWAPKPIYCGPGPSTQNVFHYRGKVVLLVNEITQSHAEWTAMALQSAPGVITIGSQTSGADGDASSLYLTGNYFTYLTGLGVFYPNGSPTQRTGVNIDVKVNPTVNGIKQGRDEVLEKALEIINQ